MHLVYVQVKAKRLKLRLITGSTDCFEWVNVKTLFRTIITVRMVRAFNMRESCGHHLILYEGLVRINPIGLKLELFDSFEIFTNFLQTF